LTREDVFLALSNAILLYWIVNWFCNFTLKIKIHYLLTTVFLLAVLSQSIWLAHLWNLKRSGLSPNSATVPYAIFSSLSRIVLFVTILLVAFGWYIARKDLDPHELVPGILASAVYTGLDVTSRYVGIGWIEVMTVIVGIVVLVGYINCIRRAIRSASSFIVAHMLVIQKSGIAPKTTPVYQKYLAMQKSFKIVVVFCVLLVLSLLGSLIFKRFIWPPMLVESIVNLIICAVLAWMMGLRKKKNRNYYLLEEDEEGEVSEFVLHDIENVNPDSSQLAIGGRTYEEGMQLPRPPRIRGAVPESEIGVSLVEPTPIV
jgi:hypothetical protein